MFAASPKPAVPTSTLKDASKAAREAGGDAQDMAAMAAAMQYRKTTGAGKMQYAKGQTHARKSVQPVANEKKYGLGMHKVVEWVRRRFHLPHFAAKEDELTLVGRAKH